MPTLIAYRVSGIVDFSLHITFPNTCVVDREGGSPLFDRSAMTGRNHISGWEFALWQ
jgi:hypothetical protein